MYNWCSDCFSTLRENPYEEVDDDENDYYYYYYYYYYKSRPTYQVEKY